MTPKNEQREHYAVEEMEQFAQKVLEKGGYTKPGYAEATASTLLEADKRGIFSHGIAGGTGLEECVKRGGIAATIDKDAEPEIIESKYPGLVTINAHGAPGHISSEIATDLVKKLARKYGIAKVFVNNANHYGSAGIWSDRVAEDGDLEGIATCTTAAIVRVMGDDNEMLDYTKGAGMEERIGTNPEAISMPHSDGTVTFDAAYTKMAISLCIKAFKEGKLLTVPHYVADKNNKSTLDSNDVFLVIDDSLHIIGSGFPLGSEHSGYKGDCKMRFIDMENCLGGGSPERIPFNNTSPDRRVSHTFQANAIDFLYPLEEAQARISHLMKDYEKYFGPNSRWPGDRAKKAIDYSMKYGIPYSKGQVETLERIGDLVDVPFNLKSLGCKDYLAKVFRK